MKRRRLIRSLATLAASLYALPSCMAKGRSDPEPDCSRGLGRLAAAAGLLYGAAIAHEAFQDSGYLDLYRRHARVLTTDVAFKFDWIRPEEETWDWWFADQIVDFAAAEGFLVRPHVLIWNDPGDLTPQWLKDKPVGEREAVMVEHIHTVMERYRDRSFIHSWDVVNEPFWPGHGLAGGWRAGPWFEAMGSGYVRVAFEAAHAADPNATLVLNEAQTERKDELGRTIRSGLYDLVQRLLDQGVPLGAVGLQGHLFADPDVDPAVYDFADFAAYVERLAGLGVDVYVTELDVSDERMVRQGHDAATRDRWVARQYRDFLDQVLQVERVRVVVNWELADGFSWLRPWAPAVRPLPFDDENEPKPACTAMAGAFQRAPRR